MATQKNATALDTIFLAMGPNAWGKGETADEAVKQCKKHIPSYHGTTHRVFVFEVDGFEDVTPMGYIQAKAAPREIEQRIVKTRGSGR